MDAATTRSMTACAGQVCPHHPHHSPSFLTSHQGQPQGLPLRHSLRPVIPGVSAEPKLRHSARSRGIHVPLHSNMDAATTRSMTACAGQGCPHHPHHSPSFLTPHHEQPQGLPLRHSLHPVIPGVSAEPKLRHSVRSRGIHVPLHSNMDAATTRSMTACAGQGCPHHPHHSPSFLTPHHEQPQGLPLRHSLHPVIPGVSAEPKLRHSVRSRGIHVPLHSNMDAATTRSMTACAGQGCPHHPHHSPSFLTSHHGQPQGLPLRHSLHPVIPGVSAEAKLRHSARSRGIHVPLHSNMDAATTRSMTACAGQVCPHHPHHSPSFLTSHQGQPQGLPLRHSLRPVIPGVSAEPKLRHSARSRGIHVPLHSNMDAATTRSMTACAGQGCPHHPHHSPSFLTPHHEQPQGLPLRHSLHPVIPGVSAEPKLRHSVRSRGIHFPLHSNMDAATTRSMTACAGQGCPHHPHHSPSFLTSHRGNHKGCPYATHSAPSSRE